MAARFPEDAGPCLKDDGGTAPGDGHWVAAIDLGTTYSGWALQSAYDFSKEKDKMLLSNWLNGTIYSAKTPTVLLLDKQEKFVSFGSEAEDHYYDLAQNEKHDGYKYFKHFKMVLHKPDVKLKMDTELVDDQGKMSKAMTVFSLSIKFLKNNLEEDSKRKGYLLNLDSIIWVLTVPAIWDADAKEFMRKAAIQAGILENNLRLALEPEAASVYCKEMNVQGHQTRGSASFLSQYTVGTKYMVIDLGGGTLDVTAFEIQKNRSLKQILCSSGGPYGGMNINKAFWDYLKEICGEVKLREMFKENKVLELETERNLEQAKRNLNDCSIDIDLGPLSETLKKNNISVLGSKKPKLTKGKLRLKAEHLQALYEPTIRGLISHFQDIFDNEQIQGINNVILVGGFADSLIVQKSLKEALRNVKNFVIPLNAQYIIMKGAAMYGNDPDVVNGRICPYYYGTEMMNHFIEGFHRADLKKVYGNKTFCTKIFHQLTERGTLYRKDEAVIHEVFPYKDNLPHLTVNFYQSDKEGTKYTDEHSCRYVGQLKIDLPKGSSTEDKFIVSLRLGDTHLHCAVQDDIKKNKVHSEFKLL